jgi:hypothetical protein
LLSRDWIISSCRDVPSRSDPVSQVAKFVREPEACTAAEAIDGPATADGAPKNMRDTDTTAFRAVAIMVR